ncbi:hypothetical protein BDF21DRAFT_429962 [Thamnidium elegans]|nr:hypothetical protein BDF21DRAFT_429962 [Thamnidium elegans]
MSNDCKLQNAPLLVPASLLHIFWSIPMLLPSRATWYRILSRKVPTASYLHTIQTIDSSQCRLCHQSVDHLNHFVLMCPKKLDIWQLILQDSDITSNISNEDILRNHLIFKGPFLHS